MNFSMFRISVVGSLLLEQRHTRTEWRNSDVGGRNEIEIVRSAIGDDWHMGKRVFRYCGFERGSAL